MGLVRFKAGIIEPQFFLYQYLSPSFQEFLGSRTIRGATVDRISIKDFPTFPIAVPPLPEQQRIVAILDEAFEGIAIAKANAEKNLQNSKELFKSHLHTLFANPANEWSRKSLLDLCNPNRGITYGVIKLGAEVPSGTPCLRTSNVRWLRIETEGMKRISAGDDATVRLRSSWLPTRVVPGQRARDHLALVYGLKGCGKRPPFPMT